MTTRLFLISILILIVSCNVNEDKVAKNTLFSFMPADETGISFNNKLSYDKNFNLFTYRNFYNGGGVAIGDINNDGLSDIYFTSNQESNKLYLNKGNFNFEDITDKAGVAGNRSWSTGVTMVDINSDGYLDIYVCNSGDISGDDKQNELFINNGDGSFTEQAKAYGLDDTGLSTHAAFFDYDRDGDLDAYVLNNSFRPISSFNLKENERNQRDSINGDRFYINEGGYFIDKSDEVGIYGSTIGFGLGIMVSDLDSDGWLDLYICNDFFERDYIYMNNGDGTFREDLPAQMPSISMASMGVDAADMNNDGYPEIFVTEMLPKDEGRLKTSMSFENWNTYQNKIKNDYHNQFTRNMFQVNNGLTRENTLSFSEMSRYSGVEATDWSWSVLMADFDLNGSKDMYITNGIYQDILNQDYLNFISSEVVAKSMITEEGINYKKLIDIIPSKPISNVAYSGDMNLKFNDSTSAWGLKEPGFSNGMAYGDLDNDGDLDLVVNNVNMEAFIYKNQSEIIYPNHHFLKIKLRGSKGNKNAIGAKVTIFQNGLVQVIEQIPTRGFQSSVDHNLHFGVQADIIDTVMVNWPSGKISVLEDIKYDQTLDINEVDSQFHINEKIFIENNNEDPNFKFKNITELLSKEMVHQENKYNDFDKDQMIFQMNSTEGPKLAIADINGDKLDDIYLGGSAGYPGKIFIQKKDGKFYHLESPEINKDKRCEDVDALFFDADNDGDMDLYVVSGGNEYPGSSSALSDRLYYNDGTGRFTKSRQLLPTNIFESTSCVIANDFDLDGDIDLFVGVRLKDKMYGIFQNGYLLENDGTGEFHDVSESIAPGLKDIGLIKDAVWADINNDQLDDLIIVGEWMPVQVFENSKEGFHNITNNLGLTAYTGWWNSIEKVDLDNDGDLDFIIGNHGLNSRFRATQDKPVTCYVNDYDSNGSIEQIICTYNGESSYPLALRHDLTAQLPYLKKRFLKYEDYKLKGISDIFNEDQLKSSVKHTATYLETAILWNEGNGSMKFTPLPPEAQKSPVYAIYTADFNNDGFQDILLGGNLFEVKPEIGKYDASYGVCLLNDGNRNFRAISNRKIGLHLEGQIRDIQAITLNQDTIIMVARNDRKIQALELNSPF